MLQDILEKVLVNTLTLQHITTHKKHHHRLIVPIVSGNQFLPQIPTFGQRPKHCFVGFNPFQEQVPESPQHVVATEASLESPEKPPSVDDSMASPEVGGRACVDNGISGNIYAM